MLAVEICWIERERVERQRQVVQRDATVADALERIGRADLLTDLREGRLTVAIFGEHARADTRLHDGDRIELLAGITADPKVSRARRAEVQRQRQGDARWQRR